MRIIFITYINRSGSTYLSNLFSKSGDILVCPEADILVDLFLVNPEKKFSLTNNKELLNQIISYDKKLKYWEIHAADIQLPQKPFTNFDLFIAILISYKNKVNI